MADLSDKQRTLLFWFGCLPARSVFAGLAAWSTTEADLRPLQFALGAVACVIAIGLSIAGLLNKTTGAFGGVVWWKKMRIVHASNYLLFAALIFSKIQEAWVVLVVDVVIAAVAWYFLKPTLPAKNEAMPEIKLTSFSQA